MAKYKQKAIPVDARQFNKTNGKNLAHWIKSKGSIASHMAEVSHDGMTLPEKLYVYTDQGEVSVKLGEWIVEIDSTFRVYSNDEFKKRFETA